jgi:hypothetical protein
VLDELTTDPVLIPNADNYELSYEKRESVMGDTYEAIREFGGDLMLHKWAPDSTKGGSITRTSGATRAAKAPGATGNRKALAIADVIAAQEVLDRQNISKTDRIWMLPASHKSDLLSEMSLTQNREFSMGADFKNGIIGQLYGFKFMDRSTTPVYKNGTPPTLVAFGAAGDTDHCEASIYWQRNAVERALGTVQMFEDTSNPAYYGDIYSTLLRLGGRPRRADGKGFGAVVETVV